MELEIQKNPRLNFAIIGTTAAATLLGFRYPVANLVVRLAFSLLAFTVMFFVPRKYLKASWLWVRFLPLFILHWAVIAIFRQEIRQLNIWFWGGLILIEFLVVSVIIIRGLPEERAYHRRAPADASLPREHQ